MKIEKSWEKSLYERRKGKRMEASGTWKATRQEDLLVKGVGLFFAVSVITTLIATFFRITALVTPAIICLVFSFISMFVVLFGLAYLKSREQPMEKHYYSDDYEYKGLSGEVTDNGREITREEFYGKNPTDPNQ
ncbi:MAG: hypothetical protein K6A14_00445 [Erysipelotrichaceae bacterium]|nr:hypothetical protein [Erysipelotrichaceae bacterium]